MKIIILILANDNNIYLKCQSLWKKYMNLHPNIKSYFIKFKKDISKDGYLEDDTIYIDGEESLKPGCLIKTIESINFILNKEEFDYIFRTNMSSVIDLYKFYDFIKNKNDDCMAISGIYNNNNIKIKFPSGAGFLLSKKICQQLIDNKDKINYNLIDDVAIGLYLQNQNINIYPLTRFEAYNYDKNIDKINNELIKDYYHFRCKSFNMELTPIIMKKVIDVIYNIT